MHIILVACLEWWNSHFNIRCSFETGHWTQIRQEFPTLWRMLMSRIQHLRTRLPIHIGFVPVKKPGEETKERNHQSTTNTSRYTSCEQKFFRQCPDAAIYIYLLMEDPCHSDVRFFCNLPVWTRDASFWLPKSHHSETYPNSKFQAERSSFLCDISTHDIHGLHSPCHIRICYLKHQGNQAYISTPRGRATTFKPRQPRLVTVLTVVLNCKVKNAKNIKKSSKEFTRLIYPLEHSSSMCSRCLELFE